MRILWIVNTIFPYPSQKLGLKANVFGGWLNSLFEDLIKNENITLGIATVYNGKKLLTFVDGKVEYYLIPCKNKCKLHKKDLKFWKQVNEQFKPDLAHLHGTEFPFGLSFLNLCPGVKTLVSIQGLISLISMVYLSNISNKDIIKNITFRDIIKLDSIYQAKKKFYKRGIYEKKLLKKCDYIIGRTTWDYANTYIMVGYDKYFKCNESLRSEFYKKTWDIDKVEKHSIFISQASYPIKGFHIVLDAINILKRDYHDIKVYVAGINIISDDSFKNKLKINGYAKYILSKIKKYNLFENIFFTGILNEKEMVDRMLKTNVFVQASSIENSPNSLGEAMLMAMPCVASNVGGTSDMLKDKEEGFLYPFAESSMLAYYIKQVFDNDDLAIEIGKNAQKHAMITHDRKVNTNDMVKIYETVVK